MVRAMVLMVFVHTIVAAPLNETGAWANEEGYVPLPSTIRAWTSSAFRYRDALCKQE